MKHKYIIRNQGSEADVEFEIWLTKKELNIIIEFIEENNMKAQITPYSPFLFIYDEKGNGLLN